MKPIHFPRRILTRTDGLTKILIFLVSIKFTESAHFGRIGQVTGNKNQLLFGPQFASHFHTIQEEPSPEMTL